MPTVKVARKKAVGSEFHGLPGWPLQFVLVMHREIQLCQRELRARALRIQFHSLEELSLSFRKSSYREQRFAQILVWARRLGKIADGVVEQFLRGMKVLP